MMDIKNLIIAIDGHSSCGKSTIAKEVARELKYTYIDTGAMYRAVTLFALRAGFIANGKVDEASLREALPTIRIGFIPNTDAGVIETTLNGMIVEQEIRGMEVAQCVSQVAAIKSIRTHLVALQQRMGEKKRVVMDGRDIGSVVFPNAEIKFFITADPEVRAQRRLDELRSKGDNETMFEDVLENVLSRDHQDMTRAENPLIQTSDAIVIDNSHMTRDEQLEKVLDIIRQYV